MRVTDYYITYTVVRDAFFNGARIFLCELGRGVKYPFNTRSAALSYYLVPSSAEGSHFDYLQISIIWES